ncbi:hypothetical protein IG631_07176 [Alternaria alternata]|nr:hypothetical protein IG631_07176 [Alternaria alternata]
MAGVNCATERTLELCQASRCNNLGSKAAHYRAIDTLLQQTSTKSRSGCVLVGGIARRRYFSFTTTRPSCHAPGPRSNRVLPCDSACLRSLSRSPTRVHAALPSIMTRISIVSFR